MDLHIRKVTSLDWSRTRRLVLDAFHDNEPEQTAAFLDAMRAEGCILGEWLAEDGAGVLGHIVFSRVWVQSEAGGCAKAAMLTPLAVRPERQRRGVGLSVMRAALGALEARGEDFFLVLGHPAYYPKVGFGAQAARHIQSPWGTRPSFMARGNPPPPGRLLLPKSIAGAH